MKWSWWYLTIGYPLIMALVGGYVHGRLVAARKPGQEPDSDDKGFALFVAVFWPVFLVIAPFVFIARRVSWYAAGGAAGDSARRLDQK